MEESDETLDMDARYSQLKINVFNGIIKLIKIFELYGGGIATDFSDYHRKKWKRKKLQDINKMQGIGNICSKGTPKKNKMWLQQIFQGSACLSEVADRPAAN